MKLLTPLLLIFSTLFFAANANAEMRGLEVFWFHGVVTDQIPMINGYYADLPF